MLRISAQGAHTWTISIRKNCIFQHTLQLLQMPCSQFSRAQRAFREQLLQPYRATPAFSFQGRAETEVSEGSSAAEKAECLGLLRAGEGTIHWQGTPGSSKRGGHQCWSRHQIMLIRWAAGEPWAFLEINLCTTQSSSSEELASILSGRISVLDR